MPVLNASKQYFFSEHKLVNARAETKDKLAGFTVVENELDTSWISKEEFDIKYSDITKGMSFAGAMFMLDEGRKVARLIWFPAGIFIERAMPDASTGLIEECIIMYTTNAASKNDFTSIGRMIWMVCQEDMRAHDWVVVE